MAVSLDVVSVWEKLSVFVHVGLWVNVIERSSVIVILGLDLLRVAKLTDMLNSSEKDRLGLAGRDWDSDHVQSDLLTTPPFVSVLTGVGEPWEYVFVVLRLPPEGV